MSKKPLKLSFKMFSVNCLSQTEVGTLSVIALYQ
jgi:hypothetical protein